VFVLAATSCVEEATVPKIGEQPIELKVAVSASTIRVGEVDTITVTATSLFDEPVRLVFPTMCQIRAYVRNATGRVVVPGAGYSCLEVPSQIIFQPRGVVTRLFIWHGASEFTPPGSGAPLPPGDYYVTAEMAADEYSTAAFAVRITVTP
jgi:hypothetical protein